MSKLIDNSRQIENLPSDWCGTSAGRGDVLEVSLDRMAPPPPAQRAFEQRPPVALAPILGVRQDNRVGADSSRALLLTILGEFVLPHSGRVWTQTLTGLLDPLGVQDKAARQALARMHQRGWLERHKVGRQAQWTLTDTALQLLESGAQRIYAFGQQPRMWSGSWVVLLASVTERDRHLRHRVTSGLNWAGFGSIGQGVWLSPWLEQEQAAVDLLGRVGVDAVTFRAELGHLGNPRELADEAWRLDELRADYESFLADTDALLAKALTGEAAAAELASLVHRWRRFPFLDPDLPRELLPEDWIKIE